MKTYLKENPSVAEEFEAKIRADADKLLTPQAKIAARAAGRTVDVTAEEFDDE